MTCKDARRFTFTAATLRNVDIPYTCLHDGEAENPTEAVDITGQLQSSKKLCDEENAKLVAFPKTLAGDQPRFTIPILPSCTDKTPAAETFRLTSLAERRGFKQPIGSVNLSSGVDAGYAAFVPT